MNISTIAILLLAWQLLGKSNSSTPKIDDLASFLNDDTKNILGCVSKLTSKDVSNEDKTGAIFQMMTNPTVMNFAQNIFGNSQATQGEQNPPQATQASANQNDEGYVFGEPSTVSQEFFRPVEKVAGVEVKNKLCYFYDNWYLAK